MDLVQLRYFMRVVELRSVTKAAAALCVAQSAVTRQIRLLEAELGVDLFYRHSRGTDPTDAGRRLFEGAEAVFHVLTHTKADVIATSADVSGRLRVGFPPSLGDLIGLDTVIAFRAAHGNVAVSLVEGYSQDLSEKLLQDDLDLALITGLDQNPMIAKIHICDELLWLVQAPEAAGQVRGRKEVAVRDLAGIPLVQPGQSNTTRRLLDATAASHGIRLDVVIEVESIDVMKKLVARGVGSTVSPYSGVHREIAGCELLGAPVEGLAISRHLAHRADRAPSRALLLFRQLLLEHLGAASRAASGNITMATTAR
ncbi:LysR family transcriptional regulator [Aquabacter sp. P-9]|uniref:LysR family transcriptional regulator n=1 Tax=Aquabacter sediminis TaxID=3029197 RepID=UPI00237E9C52|nr:LysR family transcriptional regulator [Aquabacter sp. P-9]MDE1571153.1 LysR family transcriptional regulator [Aquabacter sp. P-9]